MADAFTLSLSLYEHGMAEAHVSCREQSLRVFPTYLSDAMGNLADAVLCLLRSPMMDFTCGWQDEPGEWRWVLHRAGEEVHIKIVRFEKNFSDLADELGEQVFSAECPLLRLATQVKGQLRRLLNEHGEQGYLLRWHYPFPMQTFRQMEAIIYEIKHASADGRGSRAH